MHAAVRRYVDVYRSLSSDAKFLLLVGSINALPFGVDTVALPLYLKLLGYNEVVIGTTYSILGGTAVALILPFGILADRFGRKRMGILAGVASGGSFLLLPFAQNLAVLFAAAVLGGVAEALFFSTLQALLADASTAENRPTVFGLSFFGTSAAAAAGSLASSSPEWLRGAGWSVVSAYLPLWLGTAAALFLTAPFMLRVAAGGERKAKGEGLLPRRSARTLSKFFAANIIIGLGAGLTVPILALWFFLKYGQTEAFTGSLFAIGNATNAFAFLAAPVLAKRYGMVRTVVALQTAATLLLLGMALLVNLPAAAVLYLGRNATMNMTWPVMSAFLMGAVPAEERASASAVVGIAFRLPFAVSTAFGAAMMAQNPDLPLLVTTGLYAVGTAAFWVFFRGVEEKPG